MHVHTPHARTHTHTFTNTHTCMHNTHTHSYTHTKHTHTQPLSYCMLLQCIGVDVGDRWTEVRKFFKSHLGIRTPVWYDTRLMMMLAHGMPGSEPAATFALVEHLIKVMYITVHRKLHVQSICFYVIAIWIGQLVHKRCQPGALGFLKSLRCGMCVCIYIRHWGHK